MFSPSVAAQFTYIDIDPARANEFLGTALTLANGQILLLSEDLGSNSDVFMRFFDLDGQGQSGQVPVNTTTFNTQEDAQVIQLGDGTLLVAWTDGSRTSPDFSGDAVRFQKFSADGQKIGAETVAPVGTNGDQALKSVVALEGGGFAVVWQQASSAFTSVMRLFAADGTPASGDIALPYGFGSSSGGHIATDGADGLIAVGAVRLNSINSVVIQRYDGAGQPEGGLTVIASGAAYRDMQIQRLQGGGHVVVWTDTTEAPPYNNGPIVRGQVIGAGGAPVGDVFTVSDDIFSEHRTPIITALRDGRFAVTWDTRPADAFGNGDDVMRVYNADGTPASEIVTVYDPGQSYEGMRIGLSSLQSVSELPDGRLVYTFSALDPTGSFFLTATRIVDPRTALDVTLGSGDDTFQGTRFDDRILGGNGDDVLRGDLGNDTLSGGSDADMLYGGDGKDRLLGDGGSDTLYGGAGADVIDGGSSADTLYGGDGADSVRGGSNKDAIYGGNQNDTVRGGTGNDTVFGGSNNDRLYGDADNDVLYGGDGSDTVSGGSGRDVIDGGSAADLLYGGSNNDTISGGAGRDTLTGGTGRDVFVFNTAIGSSVDTITDFSVVDDRVHLETSIFTGLPAGALAGAAFVSNTSGQASTAAHRLIYDSDTGALYFDADGSGAGERVHFATLSAGLALTAADFLVL